MREDADNKGMRIESNAIALSSGHQLESSTQKEETLQFWVDDLAPNATSDTVSLSVEAAQAQASPKTHQIPDGEDVIASDPKLLLLKRLIEAMTGREIKLTSMQALTGDAASAAKQAAPDEAAQGQTPRAGWGLVYNYKETYAESEDTAFTAKGIVKTADGQEIAFNLDLTMSRDYTTEVGVNIRAGDATRIDPLVINFDGTAAELSDQTFKFDLNVDGKEETLPFLAQGSGFLVFDRNKDGLVNDGSELFGPTTGNGFKELAGLDSDHNGWIDEGDSAYGNLSVWRRDTDGSESLMSLRDSGIGALSIGYAATPFDLRDETNALKGQILRTGVYLTESGQAGSVQQLDVVA